MAKYILKSNPLIFTGKRRTEDKILFSITKMAYNMRGYLITEKKVTNPEVSEKQMQEQTLEKNDPSNCHSANLIHFALGTNYEHKKPLKQMKDRRLTSTFVCPSQGAVLPTELKSVNQNQRIKGM